MLYSRKKTEIFKVLNKYANPNWIPAVLIISTDLLIFIFGFLGTYYFNNLILRLMSSIITGLMMGILFIIAHDLCHNSWFPSKVLNHLFGRLLFLITFHSYSLWEDDHNYRHHSFTNLKNKDHSYCPLTNEEYKSLSTLKKTIYKFYRSIIGIPFYYLVEINIKRIIFPRKLVVRKFRLVHFIDFLFLVIFFIFYIYLTTVILPLKFNRSFISVIIFSIFLPHIVWNFLVSFITYQQHTDINVNWYNNNNDWSYLRGQIECTTRIKFNLIVDTIFHNVSYHNAHHLNPNIPIYKLKTAQTELENISGLEIPKLKWTLTHYLKTVKTCKLYDYKNNVWKPFEKLKKKAA